MLNRIVTLVISIIVFSGLVYFRAYMRKSDNLAQAEALAAEGKFDDAYYAFGDMMHRFPDDPLPYYIVAGLVRVQTV